MSGVAQFGIDLDLASPLATWLASSFLLYIVASNVLWRFSNLAALSPSSFLLQAGRLVYGLGVPYIVLGGWPQQPYRGLLSLEALGVVGFGGSWDVRAWLDAMGTGLGVGVLALLILAASWSGAQSRDGHVRLRLSPRPWWILLTDIVYLQAHWAFYRAGLTEITGSTYWGPFVGLGLVFLEWSLNPRWRYGWRTEEMAGTRWLRTAVAFVVAFVFSSSGNLWACVAVHLLLELPLRTLGRSARARVPAHDRTRELPTAETS